jgi:hypothetical protein
VIFFISYWMTNSFSYTYISDFSDGCLVTNQQLNILQPEKSYCTRKCNLPTGSCQSTLAGNNFIHCNKLLIKHADKLFEDSNEINISWYGKTSLLPPFKNQNCFAFVCWLNNIFVWSVESLEEDYIAFLLPAPKCTNCIKQVT